MKCHCGTELEDFGTSLDTHPEWKERLYYCGNCCAVYSESLLKKMEVQACSSSRVIIRNR